MASAENHNTTQKKLAPTQELSPTQEIATTQKISYSSMLKTNICTHCDSNNIASYFPTANKHMCFACKGDWCQYQLENQYEENFERFKRNGPGRKH